MDLRKKLENVKKSLVYSKNRDYEFETEFENHPLGNQNLYRLHYVNYHRIGENYEMGPNNVGVHDWPFKPFVLPKGLNREDAFKVLSYLTDYIESSFQLLPCSHISVAMLDKVIDLERFGFTKLNINISNDKDIIDLFTVTGRQLLFKQSKHYPKYFEWYTENVTVEEVKEIYAKCGIVFFDLKDEEKEQIRSLIL